MEKELVDAIKEEAIKAIKEEQQRLIDSGNKIYKLATLNENTLSFEIGESGRLLNLGLPFKDRYPLNFRSINEWSALLGLNGGAVYGGLLHKGSRRSKNWINRFILSMNN